MPIVSIRQLHFPIELSESDFSLFHLVNQVFQIISKDDTEVGTLSKCNNPIKNFKPDILILFDCLRNHYIFLIFFSLFSYEGRAKNFVL